MTLLLSYAVAAAVCLRWIVIAIMVGFKTSPPAVDCGFADDHGSTEHIVVICNMGHVRMMLHCAKHLLTESFTFLSLIASVHSCDAQNCPKI